MKCEEYFESVLSARTLIAVPDSVEVDVEVIVVEEEQRQPGVQRVDGHEEEDAHDPALLCGVAVAPQVLVHLKHKANHQLILVLVFDIEVFQIKFS